MDHLCYLCLVFLCFCVCSLLPCGKGLTSWILFAMFNCVFVTFPCGILGQVWYLIVSIPDHCRLSYFVKIYNVPPMVCGGSVFGPCFIMHYLTSILVLQAS